MGRQVKDSTVGRPTKKTPEKMAEIIRHLRDGLPKELACNISNVGYRTFRTWVSEDEDFRQRVKVATSTAIADLMKEVRSDRGGAWKLLKNIGKDYFKENVEVDHKSTDGSMATNLTEEQIKKAALAVLESINNK